MGNAGDDSIENANFDENKAKELLLDFYTFIEWVQDVLINPVDIKQKFNLLDPLEKSSDVVSSGMNCIKNILYQLSSSLDYTNEEFIDQQKLYYRTDKNYIYGDCAFESEINYAIRLTQFQSSSHTPKTTVISTIKYIVHDINTLHLYRPIEHPNKIEITNMKELKMLIGGDVELHDDLIQKGFLLLNNYKFYVEIQKLLQKDNDADNHNNDEKLLINKLYNNVKVLSSITFLLDDKKEEK
ncbi:unnamed protein product, partial [Rotaria sp. Silwood2]